jgi:DNA-binding NarL/FixJ family response regulator
MPLTTILVEDSSTIRDSLIPAMAELAGLNVIAVAETPSAAIDAMVAYGDVWQLMVVDLFLKDGTGLSVLRACRDRLASQRVLVLTNYATEDMRQRCLSAGADAVFDKSCELDAFFECCRSYALK